jgi:hypothetical protein
VDNYWEQYKLEARKLLENGGESQPSGWLRLICHELLSNSKSRTLPGCTLE